MAYSKNDLVPIIQTNNTYQYQFKPRKHYGKFFRFLGSVCVLFLIVLFTFNVFRVVNGSSSISFTGFLNWISNADIPQIKVNVTDNSITDDWGLFNGLKNFINSLSLATQSLAWLGANVVNFVIYVSYFIFFLFS